MSFSPTVVLLDIGMPHMDGYAAARAIRGQEWGKAMHLIALTGWGQDADRLRSQEAGFDQHLVKPVHPAVLFELLGKLQGLPRPGRGARRTPNAD